MALPKREAVYPAVLKGKANGELPTSILVKTPGEAGGLPVVLVEPAARAWRALVAEAKRNGHTLKAACQFCSYRPLSEQDRIFRARYTTTPIKTTDTRFYQGKKWFKVANVAEAAVPGTSNHGRGLAVDTGEESDNDTGHEKLDKKTLGWLVDNSLRFGWAWELESEPWHLRYWAGDAIPTAVLDHERAVPFAGAAAPSDAPFIDLEDSMICAIIDHIDRRFRDIVQRDPDLAGRNHWVHRFAAAEQAGDPDKVLQVENDLLVALVDEANGPG